MAVYNTPANRSRWVRSEIDLPNTAADRARLDAAAEAAELAILRADRAMEMMDLSTSGRYDTDERAVDLSNSSVEDALPSLGDTDEALLRLWDEQSRSR